MGAIRERMTACAAWRGRAAAAVTVILWLSEIGCALAGKRTDTPVDRLVSCVTVSWTILAAMAWGRQRERERPGGRWISIDELAAMEAAMLHALLAGQGEPPDEPARCLRSVR